MPSPSSDLRAISERFDPLVESHVLYRAAVEHFGTAHLSFKLPPLLRLLFLSCFEKVLWRRPMSAFICALASGDRRPPFTSADVCPGGPGDICPADAVAVLIELDPLSADSSGGPTA